MIDLRNMSEQNLLDDWGEFDIVFDAWLNSADKMHRINSMDSIRKDEQIEGMSENNEMKKIIKLWINNPEKMSTIYSLSNIDKQTVLEAINEAKKSIKIATPSVMQRGGF